jgi:hypothetical protein
VPILLPVPYSQGVSFVFDGVRIDRITKLDVTPGKANRHEVTTLNTAVLTSGSAPRATKQYAPGDVEPPTVKADWLGNVPLGTPDRGRVGMLTVAWSGGTLSGQAQLSEISTALSVNDVVRGSGTFEFLG